MDLKIVFVDKGDIELFSLIAKYFRKNPKIGYSVTVATCDCQQSVEFLKETANYATKRVASAPQGIYSNCSQTQGYGLWIDAILALFRSLDPMWKSNGF